MGAIPEIPDSLARSSSVNSLSRAKFHAPRVPSGKNLVTMPLPNAGNVAHDKASYSLVNIWLKIDRKSLAIKSASMSSKGGICKIYA